MLKNIAIIPARGGSKGIQKKNLKKICGKPLIAWSILQCLKANKVDQVWVTSDDTEILNTAKEYGAEIIKRPKELAADTSSSEEAWLHAIEHLSEKKITIDNIIGIQATSPLRTSKDIDNAILKFEKEHSDTLLSVVELEDFFVWEKINGIFKPINYDYKNRKLRQNIKKRYLENGSFYIFKKSFFENNFCRLGGKISYFKMDKYKMFQVDNHEDFILCETIMNSYKLNTI